MVFPRVLHTAPTDTYVNVYAAVFAAGVWCECGAGWAVLPAVPLLVHPQLAAPERERTLRTEDAQVGLCSEGSAHLLSI
jgi:hypothetical protein